MTADERGSPQRPFLICVHRRLSAAKWVGVSWGVAWARGMVGRTQTFALTANDGKSLPLQAWPLAWWPEGSIKFSGFATGHGGGRVPVAICFASQNERHSVLAWWLTGPEPLPSPGLVRIAWWIKRLARATATASANPCARPAVMAAE